MPAFDFLLPFIPASHPRPTHWVVMRRRRDLLADGRLIDRAVGLAVVRFRGGHAMADSELLAFHASVDLGCVEAAVMSGMQAARALSGEATVIPGEDHSWLAGHVTT